MITKADIFNMALGLIGQSDQVQNPAAMTKPEATCRRFYDQVRHEWLQDSPWPFATKAVPLALVSSEPRIGYGLTYQRPADAVRVWTICTAAGVRTWLNASRNCWYDAARYSLPQAVWQQLGQQILTDEDQAYCIYTADVTEAQMTNAKFVGVLSLALAAAIAPAMLGAPAGQQIAAQLGQRLIQAKGEAIAATLNEQGQEPAAVSPSIQARW